MRPTPNTLIQKLTQNQNNTLIKKLRNNKKPFWFTLVELIVVITILVILWTIAFTSLSGFSWGARDSSRVSDLTNLSKALDIVYQKTGSYPTPDNSFTVTYSGGTIWTQGTIWDTTLNFINAWWGIKMNKKPTDPLTTNKEYTYSKLFYWNAYQIKSDWEGDTLIYQEHNRISSELNHTNLEYNHINPEYHLINQAQAATGNPTLTYIKSNYNGIVAKTESGSTKYLIAVPSLFLNASSWTVVLLVNTQTGFYIQWKTNSGWILFTPKLVFSSGSLPSNDTERVIFASGIANAYSGTILATSSSIAPFITAASTNNTTALASLGWGVVSGSLGGGNVVSMAMGLVGPTYTVSWTFWVNGSGATINGCGKSTIATSTGTFSFSSIASWVSCNSIAAIRTGYTCPDITTGPSNVSSNIVWLTGVCTNNRAGLHINIFKDTDTDFGAVNDITRYMSVLDVLYDGNGIPTYNLWGETTIRNQSCGGSCSVPATTWPTYPLTLSCTSYDICQGTSSTITIVDNGYRIQISHTGWRGTMSSVYNYFN